MSRAPMMPSGFGTQWTPLVRNVILTLFAIYVVGLLAGVSRVMPLFGLMPVGGGLLPWQPLTFSFVGGAPGSMLWQFVGVFFFLQPVVDAMSQRRMWLCTLFTWGFALVVKIVAELVGALDPAPVIDFGWWVTALVTWFGFTHRGAEVRLMFVLPVKAEMLAWLGGLLALLYVLFSRDTASLHMLAAFVGAWIALQIEPGTWRRLKLRWKKRKIERELGKFEVIEGGRAERPRRGDPKDWVN